MNIGLKNNILLWVSFAILGQKVGNAESGCCGWLLAAGSSRAQSTHIKPLWCLWWLNRLGIKLDVLRGAGGAGGGGHQEVVVPRGGAGEHVADRGRRGGGWRG